jgi:hypothetical protein
MLVCTGFEGRLCELAFELDGRRQPFLRVPGSGSSPSLCRPPEGLSANAGEGLTEAGLLPTNHICGSGKGR